LAQLLSMYRDHEATVQRLRDLLALDPASALGKLVEPNRSKYRELLKSGIDKMESILEAAEQCKENDKMCKGASAFVPVEDIPWPIMPLSPQFVFEAVTVNYPPPPFVEVFVVTAKGTIFFEWDEGDLGVWTLNGRPLANSETRPETAVPVDNDEADRDAFPFADDREGIRSGRLKKNQFNFAHMKVSRKGELAIRFVDRYGRTFTKVVVKDGKVVV
jgi:hypothetical protein